MLTVATCLLVFACSTLIDYAHTQCVKAIGEHARRRAALWSVIQWSGATVGFLVAIKITLWALPFEAAGLFVGTFIAVGRKTSDQPTTQAPAPKADAPILVTWQPTTTTLTASMLN
jgi:hypothetical protein